MAFVAVVPAIGAAVMPAIGAIGTGLGAAASGIGGALATGAGAIGSGLGALGGALGGIPVIGGALGNVVGGLGSGIGALGSGLGGGIGALGAGNLSGAVSSLGSGLYGAGANVLGGVGGGLGSLGKGLGGLYGGADKLFGGFLPGGISPAQGYAGKLLPNAIGQNPMFGGVVNPENMAGGMSIDKYIANEMAMNPGAPAGGGFGGLVGKGLGALGKIGETAGTINTVRNLFDPPGATTPGVYNDRVIQRGTETKPIIYGGGQTPVNQQLNLTGQPQAMLAPMPGMGAGLGAMGGYRDEISELVEEAIAGKDNDSRARQSDSLKSSYGGRTTTLA